MNNKIYPFKFLDSYTAKDKDIFFGRDEEIKQLYEMIYQSDILLLYGASGTGKTSLIQCGLASQFQKHDWLEIFVRRHKNLNESLDKSLIAVGGQSEASTGESENLDWLNDLMRDDGQVNLATKTLSQTQVFLKNIYLKHFRPIYLIFDQFEELFILGSKKEQAQFIATIREILTVEQPVKLIFSIREEYLGSLYEFEKIVPELLRKKLRIDPMNLEKVKAVVLGATRSKKSIVHINEEEAEAISEQVFEKIRGKEKTLTIQLPYLQVFLDKFYRHISKDKSKIPTTEATYTLKSLAEIGDIGNILRDFLDEQIVEIANNQECERKTIWKILSPFVTIDGTKEPIGIDELYQIFPDVSKKLIEHVVIALMNNRILRYIEEEELYEIAHDSLALRIAEKRSDDEIALLEVRNLIKSQSLLKDEARELFSKKQLDFISPFLKRLKLSPEEIKLIEESKKKAARYQKKAIRRKLVGVISIVFIFAILIVFLIISQKQRKEAEDARSEALAANKVNEKIIGAMDFYDEKYALAFKDGKYGFIDKDGCSHPRIDFEYDKGEPFDLETGFAEMEIYEIYRNKNSNTKYLIDTSGNKYRLVNISEVLEDGGNAKSILSKENIEWLKKKIRKNKKQKKLLSKLEQIQDGIESGNRELISILNKGKLALDFSGLTKVELLNILQTIGKSKQIKDRVELLFLAGIELETLPSIISEFQNLRVLDLSRTKIRMLPDSFFKLINLVRLDLSYTPLKTLPSAISEFQNLRVLDLSGTKIRMLPDSFFKFMNLVRLNLHSTPLKTLSKGIGKLTNLRTLSLPRTLKELPISLFDLKGLENLDLSAMELELLPARIGELTNLRTLFLPGTLKELPISLFDLKELEDLDLSTMELETLPEEIGELTNLRTLFLPGTLKELPISLFDLKELEDLDLSTMELETLPEEIGKLTNLHTLFLPSTLKEPPISLFDLKELERLDLSAMELETLPEEIGELTNLRTLFLPGTLKELPSSIFDLKRLERLGLSAMELETLPEEIGKLTNLCSLSLPSTLKELPSSIFDLKRLERLGLSATELETLPEEIGKLTNLYSLSLPSTLKEFPSLKGLEDLDLSAMELETLPEEIGELTNLRSLSLPSTLKELPSSLFNLKGLEWLDLRATELETLPEKIGKLTNLYSLSLPSTLKELPSSIFDLKRLEDLDLSATKLEMLPEVIREQINLKYLHLSSTLKELPSSIFNLKGLKWLDLSTPNTLKELPSSLFNLKGLKWLDLSATKLEMLPEVVREQTNLKSLSLPSTLKELPSSLFNLKGLKWLDLSATKLGMLPARIGELTDLRTLFLPSTFKRFPSGFFDLKGLEDLDLSATELETLPARIGELTGLHALSLPSTFKRFPISFFDLKGLEDLDLSATELETLPERIGELTGLHALSLPSTLKELPSNIHKLKNLTFCTYTLDKNNTNYIVIKEHLKTLQKQLPDCHFIITDEEGKPIELSKSKD